MSDKKYMAVSKPEVVTFEARHAADAGKIPIRIWRLWALHYPTE